MTKFLIELITCVIDIAIAVLVVYILGWITGSDVDDLVGWAALGMAASNVSNRKGN